jgi:hypothetical protein
VSRRAALRPLFPPFARSLHPPQTDPLSTQAAECTFRGWTNCTPMQTAENCIATRGDLNPAAGVWALPAFGHRNHVSSDSKITSFSVFNKDSLPATIISGPTNSNPSTPTFRWSEPPL